MMRRRKKNTVIALVAGAIGLSMIIVIVLVMLNRTRYTRYSSERYKFSILHPVDWVIAENKEGVPAIFYSPLDGELDFFQENVNVVLQDISDRPMFLEDYSQVAIEQMLAVFKDKMEILDSGPTRLAGRDGYKLIFIGDGPQGKLKFFMYWTLDGYTVYQVTFTTMLTQTSKYERIGRKMIRSFKIL